MTDPDQSAAPSPDVPQKGPNRGLKIALAVSVALNLAVAGLVGGLAFMGGPGMHGDMAVRDLGFGPFDGALSPKDRDSLRTSLRAHLGDVRSARKQLQADGLAILSALKAEPFDPVALSTAMDGQVRHLGQRLEFGSAIIRDHLLALSDAERLAFAGRLEQRMRLGRGDDGEKGGN